MRTETAEAFSRLVSTFVTLIESTGSVLPNDIEQRIVANPLKACELLNELALSCDAIDEQTDAILAAIFESMDPADARAEVDEDTQARLERAFARSHREPEPKLEPEPEPAREDPEVWEGHGEDSQAEEQERKEPRRRGRKAHAERRRGENGDEAAPERAEKRRASKKSAPKGESSADEGAEAAAREQEAPAAESAALAGGTPADASAPAPNAQAAPAPEATAQAESPTAPETQTEPAHEPKVTSSASPEDKPGHAGDGAADDKPAKPAKKTRAKAAPVAAKAPEPGEEVLTVDQAIAVLKVSRPTVYKLIESGKLPAFKKGRSWQISAKAVAEISAK